MAAFPDDGVTSGASSSPYAADRVTGRLAENQIPELPLAPGEVTAGSSSSLADAVSVRPVLARSNVEPTHQRPKRGTEETSHHRLGGTENTQNANFSSNAISSESGCVDLAICLLLLPLGLVLSLACALAILVDSPGPIFIAQERTGRDGKRFRMYKFRTMVPNAEAQAVPGAPEHPSVPRLQDHRRPSNHPGRENPPEDKPRRDSAAHQRPSW